MTTLKATGQDRFHNYFFPFTEGFDYAAANDFDSVRHKADEMTCAVMMELVQGEGGVLPLEKEFVQQVEAFCRERDILLIIDEVQTGIGPHGSLFCFQQYGIRPDVVTMAKGLGGGVRSARCWRRKAARTYSPPAPMRPPSAARRSCARPRTRCSIP